MELLTQWFNGPQFGWIFFHIIVLTLLVLDLGVFHKKNKSQTIREAFLWSLFWIACGLLFSLYIFYTRGAGATAEYLTAYVVEKSLSVDNLFVFLVIFSSMKIEMRYQHRLLFWGIIGAIILRGIMIFAGIALVELFHPILYIFGAFLVWTGIKLLKSDEKEEFHPEKSKVFRFLNKLFPIDMNHSGSHFIIKKPHTKAGWAFTRSFIALCLIESSDVLFAVDSVPAVLGISKDSYIVYTSNIFAILGLRSLFFVLESLIKKFKYLNYGISAVLVFVGLKMMLEKWIHITPMTNLMVIGLLLGGSVVASNYKRSHRK